MEELRQATFDYTCYKFLKEIRAFEEHSDYLDLAAKWVIDLARHGPNLFRLLYLSAGFKGNGFLEAMMDFEGSRCILGKMAETYGLEQEACKDILTRSNLFLTGIGTMICVNSVSFSEGQAEAMFKLTFSDMVRGAQKID